MADILGKDLDKLEDSLATRQPFNLTESDVTGPQFMTGSDFVRSAKVTPDWKMPVAIPSQASGSTYKIAQPFITGGQALFNVFADYLPNMANLSAQYAMELTGKKKEPEDFITNLRKGTEIGGLYYDVARVLGMGMLGADAIANRKEYEEKAKTYDELVELLDNREYPLTKYARRVLANTTDDVETRHLVQEMYNQSRGIDSSKWYNEAGSIIGAMIPTITVARGAGATARAFGASRTNAVNTAQNVAKGFIGGQMAGEYAEQTAADYLKRTGDKTFSNFTAEDAHGLSAMAIGAINAQIEFLGGVESIATGAVSKIGLRSSLGKAGLKTGLGEMGEEWLQDWTEFLGRKIDGTTDKTWGEEFKDSVSAAVWGLFIGGPMGAAAFYTNRRNLVKGIKQAMPNISDTQAENVADAMIDNVAEASSQDPTLRKSLRDKVSMMYETSDIDNKEDTIDAITDLEYSLIVADSAERGIEIADNPIFQGEVNELGWFRESIPEERRTEIQGYINELNDLKTELKKLNEAQEKDWAKIDEIENKLDKFNRYVLDKLSDLARADARQVAKILNETEQRFVNKEKKKKGVKVPADVLYQPRETYDGLTTSTNVPSVRAFQNLPKEKQFRVLYDSKNKLWFLADADNMTHIDMFIKGWEQGNYPQFSTRSQAEQAFNEDYTADEQNLLRFMVKNYNTPVDAKQGMEHILGTDEYNNAYLRDNTVIFARYESDLEDSGFPAETFDHYKVEYKDDERKIVLVPNEFDLADENARLDDIYPEYTGETIEVDGKERTVYNSNGDRIAKSKEALTNFWRWFGDSKVVDEQGRPLVVYHGARTETRFDTFRQGVAFFTSNRDVAQVFSDEYAYNLVVDGKKIPLDYDTAQHLSQWLSGYDYGIDDVIEWNNFADLIQERGQESYEDARDSGEFQSGNLDMVDLFNANNVHFEIGSQPMAMYLKIETPKIVDANGQEWLAGKFDDSDLIDLSGGYDGSIVKNIKEGGPTATMRDSSDVPVADDYIVYSNTQIKSVDNRGTFSEDTENIYYQDENVSLLDRPIDPRWVIPKVRGGWTKEKILRYLKSVNSYSGAGKAAREIANFDSVEDFKNHVFYHGARYGTSGGMTPSITMSNKEVERIGGGGYGEKYWAISLTKSKRVAGNIATAMGDGNIYPVLLVKNAKVIEMPELQDSADLDDHIVDLYEKGVDAVWIGDKNSGEQELAVINPKAIINIGTPEFYNAFGLGTEKNPIRLNTEEDFRKIYEFAKNYKNMDKNTRLDEAKRIVRWQNRASGGAPSTYRGAYIPQYRFIQRANNMDASTLSHELAHDWFEVNFARYRSGKATKDFMRAWGALEKALGVEENAKVPPRKASEAFARAYEGWIMNKTDWEKLIAVEDKDKDAIVKLMQDYQNNLRDIYQDLTSPYFKQTWGKLGELKPELVQWFDRMVNITDLDVLAERGEISQEQANQEKLNRAIDTVIENTTDPEGKKQLEYARTLNDTQRYEVEGGNKNALQRRIGALAQAIDENNMLIKENYDTRRDMLEVARQADNFVRTRLDDALAIINGQMAEQEGLFREDIYTALERLALENGDLGLLDELKNSEIANRLAKELGQRVAGFRNWNAGEVDVASAIKTLDNRFNKALQNKKAQVQLNEAESMFKKAQEQQDKLADKELESILNELRCK